MAKSCAQHLKEAMGYKAPSVIPCKHCHNVNQVASADRQGWDYMCRLNPAVEIKVEGHMTCDFSKKCI